MITAYDYGYISYSNPQLRGMSSSQGVATKGEGRGDREALHIYTTIDRDMSKVRGLALQMIRHGGRTKGLGGRLVLAGIYIKLVEIGGL